MIAVTLIQAGDVFSSSIVNIKNDFSVYGNPRQCKYILRVSSEASGQVASSGPVDIVSVVPITLVNPTIEQLWGIGFGDYTDLLWWK